MGTHDSLKPISSAQLVGILAFTLALFFVVSFGTKSVEAFRLRSWRNQLQADIREMERERAVLQAEIERRQSMAWVDKVLRTSGQVPEGVVRVIIEPIAAEEAAGAAAPEATEAAPEAVAKTGTLPTLLRGEQGSLRAWANELFHGPHWDAWMGLIWGFDDEDGSYYNPTR